LSLPSGGLSLDVAAPYTRVPVFFIYPGDLLRIVALQAGFTILCPAGRSLRALRDGVLRHVSVLVTLLGYHRTLTRIFAPYLTL
jgi:hypothetical protein